MIKIKCSVKGRETVILALSFANLDRLREDALSGFIQIKAEDMDIPFDILITAGETEQAMFDAFQPGFGADTKLHIDPKQKQ